MAKGTNQKKLALVKGKAERAAPQMARAPVVRKTKSLLVPVRVIIKYDVGFTNFLSIRGQGAGLSWNKGVPLCNIGPDEWVWESAQLSEECEFKVLINDVVYEVGENHRIYRGGIVQYTPQFPGIGQV